MKKIAIIDKNKYAIIKTTKPIKNAFANINDKREITVIIEQSKIKNTSKIQKDYRLITFDMILPFNMVGFIAKISKSLAKAKIPIFVISAFSTDHILIKDKYLNKAIIKLKSLGFEVKK